ncbi:MAG: cytidylate kinase-like family protein, partial [Planctomycetota bacterium]
AMLSEKLNWPLFDRQILSVMAGDDEVRARLYETMDERDLGWIENTFRSLMQSEFHKNDYFYRLTETLLCLASQGHAIFVGRSADLILPKNKGLRVKVIASLERCAQNFAQHNDCSIEPARRKIARIEKERKDFIWNHFHIDAYEPSRFDMFINLERFTTSQAVDMILLVLKLRGVQY